MTSVLNESEKMRLTQEIISEKELLWSSIPFSIVISAIFVFLPGKRSQSMYAEYGFWWPFCILASLFCGSLIISGLFKLRQLRQDLNSNVKTVEKVAVLKKERHFSKDKYFLLLDTPFKAFQKFEFSKEEYNAVAVGSLILLEYGEQSKVLFNKSISTL